MQKKIYYKSFEILGVSYASDWVGLGWSLAFVF